MMVTMIGMITQMARGTCLAPESEEQTTGGLMDPSKAVFGGGHGCGVPGGIWVGVF